MSTSFLMLQLNHICGEFSRKNFQVRLSLCNNVPVVVEYGLSESGHLRFYLAPKIDDEDADMK